MRTQRLAQFACAILFSACTITSPQKNPCGEHTDDPIFGLICHDSSTIQHIADLLERSGYSLLPAERAAFLVGGADARMEWVYWPASYVYREAGYRGRIPSKCLAIIHTHPFALPEISPGDAVEARRLGIPVVAVTPFTFAIVWPDGQSSFIHVGAEGWIKSRGRKDASR